MAYETVMFLSVHILLSSSVYAMQGSTYTRAQPITGRPTRSLQPLSNHSDSAQHGAWADEGWGNSQKVTDGQTPANI